MKNPSIAGSEARGPRGVMADRIGLAVAVGLGVVFPATAALILWWLT